MFKIKPTILSLLTLVVLVVILAPAGFGQAIDGNLVGAVLDPTGATIPSAMVTLENSATGLQYTATTSTDGLYRFNNVPVGGYALTVQAGGFADTGLNVNIELNKTATANVNMQLRGVTAEVAVVDAPSTIDTTTAQLQSSFQAEQIVNHPIIESAGNFYGALNLSLLSAGVASNGGIGQGTGPSVGGQRPANNNFMIEGVDNNRKDITGPIVYIPRDATQEFSILQNQFNSEFGHSTGGQFNTIMKTGTNDIHGSFYEYFQNRRLNATDQAFKRQGTPKPRFDQNRLGASVGGPIQRNKWFYFGNFEFAPLGQASTTPAPVYSPTSAGYELLEAMSGLSKTNLGVLRQYATAAPVASKTTTVNGVTIPIGILPIAGPNYNNQYAVVGTSDYTFSDRDQLRGRFAYNRVDTLDTNANLPAFWANAPERYSLFTVADYHTFSSNLFNEARLGYNRFKLNVPDPGLEFPGLDRFPNISFATDLGLNIGPSNSAPINVAFNTYQFVDNLSWFLGSHNFKFGSDVRRSISPQHFIARERGEYVYRTIEAYLLDAVPDNSAQRNLGSTQYYGNLWATYLYGQDEWHIRRNVTLSLGLRWERTGMPFTNSLQAMNSISDVPGLLTFRAPKASNKNFAPRIGFAYSPGTSGTTSIRAGFGIAYDVIFDNVSSTAYPPQLSATIDARNFPSIFAAPFLANGGIRPGSVATGTGLSQAQARAATSSYIPDQVLPYSIQWNLGVQHEFGQDYTLEVRYLGTRGVHLLVQNRMFRFPLATEDQSLPTYLERPSQATLDALPLTLAALQANAAARRNPVLGPYGFTSNIGWWPGIGNSSYHGLATQLTRRLSRGMQLLGAYTWSHNIDDSTATHFTSFLTPRREQDFMNLRVEKANSTLDRRHRLTLNWTYEPQWMKDSPNWIAKNLLGNWRWVGTYTYESPQFVTVQSNLDSNLNGDPVGDRAIINLNGDPKKGSDVTALRNSNNDIVAYVAIDPSAKYVKAGSGAYPNAARNTLATRPIDNFDMSFAKEFPLRENQSFELRGDFTNIFNHAQYTPGYLNSVRPQDSYVTTNDFLTPGNATFAQWDQVFSSNPRSVQLGLRYKF